MTYLGYKIAHDPGYKNKSDFFFITQVLNLLPV